MNFPKDQIDELKSLFGTTVQFLQEGGLPYFLLPDLPMPDSHWESFTGQLQYITPERSVIGEFTAARHGGDFRLEFSKGGAVTLLKLAAHDGLILAEGPLAHGRWHGRADAAPAYLQSWAAVPTGFASLAEKPHRSRPSSLTLPGTRAGDKLTFHFNR